jgi:hypothetical protein
MRRCYRQPFPAVSSFALDPPATRRHAGGAELLGFQT